LGVVLQPLGRREEFALRLAEQVAQSTAFRICELLDGLTGPDAWKSDFEIYFVTPDGRSRVNKPNDEMLHDEFMAASVARLQKP
jgi:hypothetical protein